MIEDATQGVKNGKMFLLLKAFSRTNIYTTAVYLHHTLQSQKWLLTLNPGFGS